MITTDLLHELSVLFGLSIVSIQLNIVRFNFFACHWRYIYGKLKIELYDPHSKHGVYSNPQISTSK
jgi:hypothetical protein